jgi:CspA family cold shock protein
LTEGSIKRLTDKGFGFIRKLDGTDVFFHSSALEGVVFEELRVGQRVEFTEGEGPKGLRAEGIRVV